MIHILVVSLQAQPHIEWFIVNSGNNLQILKYDPVLPKTLCNSMLRTASKELKETSWFSGNHKCYSLLLSEICRQWTIQWSLISSVLHTFSIRYLSFYSFLCNGRGGTRIFADYDRKHLIRGRRWMKTAGDTVVYAVTHDWHAYKIQRPCRDLRTRRSYNLTVVYHWVVRLYIDWSQRYQTVLFVRLQLAYTRSLDANTEFEGAMTYR